MWHPQLLEMKVKVVVTLLSGKRKKSTKINFLGPGALKGTELRWQRAPKTQIFAENRRFSQIHPLILEIQAFGGRRKPQIFAGNRRLGSVTLGASPLARPYFGSGDRPVGGGLPREGVVAEKFVLSLESLSSLGFGERNLGYPGDFRSGVSRTPGGVQKVCAKKVRAHFSFPIFPGGKRHININFCSG